MLTFIIVLAVLGILMIATEVIIPGLIVGIIGGMMVIAAVILAYVHFGPEVGSLISGTIFVVGLGALTLIIYLVPKSPLGRRFTLKSAIKGETDYPNREDLQGAEGESVTDLRPSGTAVLNGNRADVVAESGMILKGEKVRVVKVEGTRVVVRRI